MNPAEKTQKTELSRTHLSRELKVNDQDSAYAAENHKESFLKSSMRPLSLLVVAFSLAASLFVVERTDAPSAAPDRGGSAAPQSLADTLAISHRNRPHRPSGPNDVDAAIRAARFAAREVQEILDRVQRFELTPEQAHRAAARLFEARAQFLTRIDTLIELVPGSEDELLEIQVRVLTRIDAVLELIEAPISG